MAEDTTQAADEDAATAPEQQPAEDLGDAGKRALQEERQQRRDLARQLKAATAELDKLRTASMTEQEMAVEKAKAVGAQEAAKASAGRLVRAELRAAAAEAGLSKDALAGFLEYADLSKFVGDSGEPDSKAIDAAVKRLGGGRTDFDGGARTPAARPADMNALIRRGAGLG